MAKAKCKCGQSEIDFKYLKEEDVKDFVNDCCKTGEKAVEQEEPVQEAAPEAPQEEVTSPPSEEQSEAAPEQPVEDKSKKSSKRKPQKEATAETVQE